MIVEQQLTLLCVADFHHKGMIIKFNSDGYWTVS